MVDVELNGEEHFDPGTGRTEFAGFVLYGFGWEKAI